MKSEVQAVADAVTDLCCSYGEPRFGEADVVRLQQKLAEAIAALVSQTPDDHERIVGELMKRWSDFDDCEC